MRRVRSFVVQNGYQKSNDIFQKNNRVRQLRVRVLGRRDPDFRSGGQDSSQFLSLPKPVQAYWLKFIIDDVWAGNKYTDTAITKLLINSDTPQ